MVHMEYLKKDLDRLKPFVREKDNDYFLCIEGRERVGKSTLALHIATYFDPKFSVEDIVFSQAEFVKRVREKKPGGVLLVDEGALVFFSSEGQTKDSRLVSKMITVMGKKNLLVITCVPDVCLLFRYIRQHRLRMLIKVYKEGHYCVFGQKGSKKYVRMKEGRLRKGEHKAGYRYRERFGKYKGNIWDDYEAKKTKEVYEDDVFDSLTEQKPDKIKAELEDTDLQALSPKKAYKLTGLSTVKLKTMYKNNKIEGYELESGQHRYFKHSLLKLMGKNNTKDVI